MRIRPHALALAIVTLSLQAAPAMAQQCSQAATVFSCTTQQGKFVQVCDQGKTLSYWYGKRGGKAELALSVPRSEASTYQWPGIGRYINYSVYIPNGEMRYQVFTSADRNEQTTLAGITVLRGDKALAEIICKPAGVISNMEDIKLKPSESASD